MFNKRLAVSAFAFLVAIPQLRGQEGQSLGDIARQLRADKDKAAAPTSASHRITSVKPNAAVTPATTAQGETTPVQQPAGSGQYAPYTTREEFNLHFLDRYEEGIRTLFAQEKFETLDGMADTARSTKSRLPGGFWTLHIIYYALMRPAPGTFKASDAEWANQLATLQRWVEKRPDSITARVGLGGAQLQYAWKARGGGYADGVSDDAWRIFQERAEAAAKTLKDASSLPAKCPEWYLTLQATARALGQSKEVQTAIFEKAIAFEPDYHYFYRTQADLLMPKWEGEEGEMAAFAQQTAERIGGKKGDIIYYEIATDINCGCANDKGLNGLSWDRIKRGYIDVEQQYGESIGNLNAMAYMAGLAGDPVYAEELFGRISEGWDPEVWHKKEYFQSVREWANGSQLAKSIEAAMKSADDNLQTPDGRKFDEQMSKTFAANYASTVGDCLKRSGESFMIPFDLILQVGENGKVEKIFVSVVTRTSICLSAQVDKGVFPAPPKPDYWVKVSLQARR
jgi:hypothetical protein